MSRAVRFNPLAAAAVALLALHLNAAPASAETVKISVTYRGATDQIPLTISRPEGAGPFPAVVFLHGCDGLGEDSSRIPRRWSEQLVPTGYVVALPDSMSSRGFLKGTCTLPVSAYVQKINTFSRAADAYAALAYLRTLAYVDGAHVAVMGDSFGGGTTLAAVFKPTGPNSLLAQEKENGFAAAIALYPGCAAQLGAWNPRRDAGTTGSVVEYRGTYQPIAPLLILIGARDDWTPAEPCRNLAERSRAAGYTVDIRIYPDAYHAFDGYHPMRYCKQCFNPNVAGGGYGTTTGADSAAREAAFREAKEFLAHHLKGS